MESVLHGGGSARFTIPIGNLAMEDEPNRALWVLYENYKIAYLQLLNYSC